MFHLSSGGLLCWQLQPARPPPARCKNQRAPAPCALHAPAPPPAARAPAGRQRRRRRRPPSGPAPRAGTAHRRPAAGRDSPPPGPGRLQGGRRGGGAGGRGPGAALSKESMQQGMAPPADGTMLLHPALHAAPPTLPVSAAHLPSPPRPPHLAQSRCRRSPPGRECSGPRGWCRLGGQAAAAGQGAAAAECTAGRSRQQGRRRRHDSGASAAGHPAGRSRWARPAGAAAPARLTWAVHLLHRPLQRVPRVLRAAKRKRAGSAVLQPGQHGGPRRRQRAGAHLRRVGGNQQVAPGAQGLLVRLLLLLRRDCRDGWPPCTPAHMLLPRRRRWPARAARRRRRRRRPALTPTVPQGRCDTRSAGQRLTSDRLRHGVAPHRAVNGSTRFRCRGGRGVFWLFFC